MHIKILLIPSIFIFLFFYCATVPNERYASLSSIPDSLIITDLNDAIHHTQPTELIPGDTLTASLSESDPVISFGTVDTFRTHYRLFRFRGNENSVYRIELLSICDSTAFDKNILFPVFILTDNKGNVLKQNNMVLYETITSNLSTAFRIYGYQDIYIADKGEYYLIVASDNSASTGYTITTVYREPDRKSVV